MSAVVFAFDNGRSYHRPWQNHELAEFYRAIDILGRAGLAVVPDMGVSDEGDPWFAFCRGDTGDVIVHFARIDGLLVATSITSKGVIRGAELRNIIDAVIRLEPLGLPVANAKGRLFLHPAVVLTAFIAAALAFSKQVDAREIHANAPHKGAETHGPFAKMVATVKAAASEMFGGIALGNTAKNDASGDQGGLNAPISLAALLSVAMSVVGTSTDTASDDATSTETSLALPAAGANDHASLHSLEIAVLSGASESVDASRQSDASPTSGVPAPHLQAGHETTPALAGMSAFFAQSDASTQPASPFQSSPAVPAHAAVFVDYIYDHPGAPPPHVGTTAVIASTAPAGDQSAPAVSETPDPTLSANLGAISPVALQVLLGAAPPTRGDTTQAAAPVVVASATGGDHSHVDTTTQSVSAAPAASTTLAVAPVSGTTVSVPAIPSTIYLVPNTAAALGAILEYGLTSHPFTGTVAVSTALAADLVPFNAEAGQPVRLIVFDSSAIALAVFELTKGVVFVNDQTLGISPTQSEAANLVTVHLGNGATMMLLGVVDTAHLTS